jgi:hypothetical protein
MNHWNEWIPESDAVDVQVPGAMDYLTCRMVANQEPIQNGRFDL